MISEYDKDITIIKKILFITITLSLLLISYGFVSFIVKFDYLSSDYSIKMVYNNGRDTCKIVNTLPVDKENGIKYNFSIIGYNNSNNDLSYKIIANPLFSDNGIRYLDEEIMLQLTNSKQELLFGPIEPLGLTEFGIVLTEIKIPRKKEDFIFEYTISLWRSKKQDDFFADIKQGIEYNDDSGYYGILLDVQKSD